MIIERVYLEDFLSHSHTDIRFSSGVTAIVGPNGAGKTSIIDAIIFALFNERARGERMTDLIRRGRERARVELVFSEAGNTYKIVRTRSRKAGDAELRRGDSPDAPLIARTQDGVTKEISRILGMDKDTLINSLFIRQGEITMLLDLSPAERKKIISKLIGIDKLETAWQNMLEVIRHFEEKAKKYDVLKAVIEEKKRKLNELKNDIRLIRQDIDEKSRELRELTVEYERVMREFSHLKDIRERYHEISEALLRLEERERALNEKILKAEKELGDAERAAEEMRALEPFVARIGDVERCAKVMAEIERMKQELRRLKDERNEISRLKADMAQNKKDYEKFSCTVSKLEELRAEEKRIREHEMRFMEVKSREDALKKEINRKKEEIERIRNQALRFLRDASVAAKDERIAELDARILEIESDLRALIDRKGRINGRLSEIAENMRLIDEASECPVCRRPLDASHKKRVGREFSAERETLLNELSQIENLISEKRNEIERLRHEREEIGMIDVARMESLLSELREDEDELRRMTQVKAELQEKIKRLDEIREDISKLEEEKKRYERGYQEYIAAEKALSGKNLDEIESEIRELSGRVMSYEAEIDVIAERLGRRFESAEEAERELRVLREKKERYEVLRARASEVEKLREEVERLRSDLSRVREEREEKKREIEVLGFSAERYEACERRYHELMRDVNGVETEINELRKREMQVESRMKSEEEELGNLSAELSSLGRLKDFVRVLKEIRDVFSKDNAQRMLRQRISPLISEYMRDFIERFNLDISDVEMNEDFEIRVIKRGGEISARAMSGGEKVAVALSLRLAIAKALSSKISAIIMDEPTTHLDEERRRELIEILKQFFKGARSILPQMIVVTHHREIEDVADNLILIENVGGTSHVKSV